MKERLEKILKVKNLIYWVVIFFTVAAEIIFTYGNISVGVIIYLFILISLLITAYFKYQESAHSLYLALTLIPLIRIISVSLPLSGIPEVFGLGVVSVPLFMAGAMVAEMLGLTHTEVGFNFNRLHNQLLLAFLGLPLGFVQFLIVQPGITIITGAPEEILIWVLILITCVGLLEEFLFRGILFNAAWKVLGDKKALYFTSLLYAALTISGESLLNVIYAFLISVLFCRLFVRQKSLLGISLAHGLINITVYVICPQFITTSTEASSRLHESAVQGIDLIVILALIGLLIFKEFLKSYFEPSGLLQSETKPNIGTILNIAIVPFLYVFSYVLIYRVLLILMNTNVKS